jgi:F-type H+-transporting ATPase subunit gamma
MSMKAVKARMKTVGNIQKITKAMKMVAAAKMRRDTERLLSGVPFCDPVITFMGHLPADERPVSRLFVGVGGDKGLCGGVNSSIVKNIRKSINSLESSGGQAQVFVLGQKPTAGLKRLYGDRFVYGIDGAQSVVYSWAQASAMAQRIDQCEPERMSFVYNHMKSAIAFETQVVDAVTKKGYQSLDKLELSKAVDQYSFEPDRVECWDDLHEFYYGATMFKGMLDSQASEQSSRMNAMENASKNAGAMLEALTLKYNRARQAKITTELCEIISGASAL